MFASSIDAAQREFAAAQAKAISSGADRGSRFAFTLGDIYLSELRKALHICLAGLGTREVARGRSWKFSLQAVEQILDGHLASAPQIVAPYIPPDMETTRGVFADHVLKDGERLKAELDGFRQGWTSPPPKPWHERNPLTAWLLAALVGAFIAKIPDWAPSVAALIR